MPPQPVVDLSLIDMNRVVADREAIARVNAQRFEFAQLDGVYMVDVATMQIVGYRDVRADEFWVRGHIPGRPIFPGVLMLETAAQLVSYCVMTAMPDRGFLGFGGVNRVKFRGTVVPGQRIVMMGRMTDLRSRQVTAATQAFVEGQLVYEGEIIGMWI